MTTRILQIIGIWALVSTAGFGLLRLLDRALTVPGAHTGADALLAAFVSLPIAVLTATTVVITRQERPTHARPLFSGRRAIVLAMGALTLEGVLIAGTDLLHPAILTTAVFIMWLGVMLGAGVRLAEIFGALD